VFYCDHVWYAYIWGHCVISVFLEFPSMIWHTRCTCYSHMKTLNVWTFLTVEKRARYRRSGRVFRSSKSSVDVAVRAARCTRSTRPQERPLPRPRCLQRARRGCFPGSFNVSIFGRPFGHLSYCVSLYNRKWNKETEIAENPEIPCDCMLLPVAVHPARHHQMYQYTRHLITHGIPVHLALHHQVSVSRQIPFAPKFLFAHECALQLYHYQ